MRVSLFEQSVDFLGRLALEPLLAVVAGVDQAGAPEPVDDDERWKAFERERFKRLLVGEGQG